MNGSGSASPISNAPSGGPINAFPASSTLHNRPFARFEPLMRDQRRQHGLRGIVAKHLGHADDKRGQHKRGEGQRRRGPGLGRVGQGQRRPERQRGGEKGQHPRGIHGQDQAAAVGAVGDHPCGQREDRPWQAQRHRHQRDQERVARQQRGGPRPSDGRDPISEIGQPARGNETGQGRGHGHGSSRRGYRRYWKADARRGQGRRCRAETRAQLRPRRMSIRPIGPVSPRRRAR